jgi:Kef-type K+ transport system membrane component KefB
MVIKQYKAKGPVTETLLSVVAIDDATALIMYSISVAIATALSGGTTKASELILKPVIEIGGALVVGAILGFLFLLPLKTFKKDGNRLSLIIAFIFIGLGLSSLCGFSSLLLCMAMGAVIANFSQDVNHLMKLSDRITPPIFMLFFVASGAELKLSVLPAVGVVGIIYIVVRVIGKMFGASLGATICKADKNIRKYLGPALVPQAGVAIGLSLVASTVVPQYATEIRTVILCGTLVYELVGPAIAKASLKKSGEIKAD